jgi:hypothetical protein
MRNPHTTRSNDEAEKAIMVNDHAWRAKAEDNTEML